jgi:hypothetical protein
VDHVIPWVPVRQWVLSLPFKLRYRMAYDSTLTADVLNIFIGAVFCGLQLRAREWLGLRQSQCGAVTFIQRFNGGLGLNVHFHSVVFDGVYAANGAGHPEFHELPPPDDADVLATVTRIAERVQDLIEGLDDEADSLSENDPGLASVYAAAVRGRIAVGPNAGNRVHTWGDRIDGDSLEALSSPRCAAVSGFNLHANVHIGARDRERLERLLRYAARPAVALDRLSKLPDGRLAYRLKRIWSNGATAVVFEPQDFIARLAALVPAPRVHLTRFHGILAPAASWRSLIVPKPLADEPIVSSRAVTPTAEKSPSNVAIPANPEGNVTPTASRPNYTWAILMMRVFQIDVLRCKQCGGRLQIIAAIHPPDATRKILACLGLPCRAPPLRAATSPPSSEYL